MQNIFDFVKFTCR